MLFRSLYYIFLVLGLYLAFLLLSLIVMKVQSVRRKFSEKYTILEIRVSKENESGPIVAEHIFSTLHGIQKKFSFWQKLAGYSSDHVSFEIASIGRFIKFYVSFPEKLRNLVEGQIYAQYPDVEISDCEDYVSASRHVENAVGVNLKLIESDVFPIKRYSQFEDKLHKMAVDPIAGITSALVKFDDVEDEAWIQVVTTPLEDKWRIIFTKCVRILKKGVFANINKLKTFYAKDRKSVV